MVNADFLGYKILGALDMPEIIPIPFSVSQGGTITGVSSLGEPATVPTALLDWHAWLEQLPRLSPTQ